MANLPPCPIKRAEIIEALRKNQPCTANELAELTGDRLTAMCSRLAAMVRDGLVTIQRLTSKPNLYSLPGFTGESKPEHVGIVASPVLAETIKPKTPEQLRLDSLKANKDRAADALTAERQHQKIAKAQQALSAARQASSVSNVS